MRLKLHDSILYLIENDYINAKKLKFSYEKRNISYNGVVIVSDGKCISKNFLGLPVEDGFSFEVEMGTGFINTIETLYEEYFLSARKHTKGINFVAKKCEDPDDILKMLDELGTEYKRVRLESFLYCVAVGNLYDWEFGQKWFWVSNRYKKLYLYKRWFTT